MIPPAPEGAAEQLRLLVESVRDYAILSLDVGGRVTSWNAGAEHIKGYRSDEILGRHFSVFYPPEDVANQKPETELRTAAREGRVQDEGWRVRRDGSRFWANVSITALYDDDHQLRGFGKVTRDMSEPRAAEAALAQARDMAVQATLEAEAATRAKSAFLAMMSHEIRTPLNAVIGMTSLLQEAPLAEEQRGYVEIVHDSGEALLAIINDILDFSKIEAGHLELEEAPFDVRDCLDNAVGQLGHVARQRGLELVTQVDEGCPRTVVGDATRFRQVVLNLLSNAVKFTTSGEVVLTATCEQPPEETDGSVLISVRLRDTGSGIPEDQLHRLFEPFSQADSSTTRVYGGTGLGLAISRRLARAMGGDLSVSSVFGKGSTFSFTARLGSRADTDDDAALSSVRPLAGHRVLVVDDNQTSQQMLGQSATGWGMIWTGAASVAEALRVVASSPRFDVVLLDLELSGLTAGQLIPVLQAVSVARPVVILGLTGASGGSDAAAADLVDAVLSKPVRSKALHERLLQLLTLAGPARRVGAPQPGTEESGVGRPDELRVLMAEDNVVNQRVGRLLLQRLGHQLDIVGTGGEALAAVHDHDYDVVLMDMQMPEMDGLEATRRIRAELPQSRQPYIVAMTANAFDDDWAACTAAGMDDFLPKPVRVKDLEAKLAQVPRRSAQNVTASAPG